VNGEVNYQCHLLFALGDKGSSVGETKMLRLLKEGWPCEPSKSGAMMARDDPAQVAIVLQDVSLLHDALHAVSSARPHLGKYHFLVESNH
jgi:hypothetical protein